jgi:hypothetical protein
MSPYQLSDFIWAARTGGLVVLLLCAVRAFDQVIGGARQEPADGEPNEPVARTPWLRRVGSRPAAPWRVWRRMSHAHKSGAAMGGHSPRSIG